MARKRGKGTVGGPEDSISKPEPSPQSTPLPAPGEVQVKVLPVEAGASPQEPPTAAVLRAIAVALLLIGVGVAAYLSYTHLRLVASPASFESWCNLSATFNCDAVNTSDYSELFGFPIALFAIPTYLTLSALLLASLGRDRKAGRAALRFAFGISFLTVLTSVFLAIVSIFDVGAVCVFCIAMYAVNIGAFALTWVSSGVSFGTQLREISFSVGNAPLVVGKASGVLLISSGLSVAAERFVHERMLQETLTVAEGIQGGRGIQAGSDPDLDADDATYGPRDAKVTLVEYADFQCGFCKRQSYTVKTLKESYGDRVLFVFKHFPMSPDCNSAIKNNRHPYACEAALAGQCAAKLGRFWEFHDITFKNQKNLETDDLLTYAERVGLDRERMRQCMRDPAIAQAITKDVERSRAHKITGTPRTFINGKEFRGIVAYEVLEREILSLLGEAARTDVTPIQAEADAADPAQSPEQIEVGLTQRRFFIDAFEASRGPRGEAVSAHDRKPMNNASWYDAAKACQAAGRRVCTQEEWVAACQGAIPVDDDGSARFNDDLIEGNEFSYSDFYEARACNDGEKSSDGRLAFTGSFTRCRTASGIYDLNGNVQEWVGADEKTAVLMGGHYYDGEKASCFRTQETFGAGFANKATGFRCCADP